MPLRSPFTGHDCGRHNRYNDTKLSLVPSGAIRFGSYRDKHEEVMSEGVQTRQPDAVAPNEGVISQHGRDRYREPQRSHNQCFTHGAGYFIKRTLTG
jgi:hypothetical protein